ncbi:hypothetical protein KG112_06815 [Nocardioides sp. zg-ZUI104]|uniref:hypothetical protein n=1 Tax=Nocardioides faecalis TaxID=2803858 RepID=UPI001BCD0A5B|nr:hypothetical protein [Nocardioides faecalis]MBS4752520.1 hypothetical protein [Nocardioides faecalis]
MSRRSERASSATALTGFLERRRRISTVLTLVLLIAIGALIGGGLGLALAQVVDVLLSQVSGNL